MFGTLKPHKCTLEKSHEQNHWRFYCGLCKSLGDEYGQAHRALVNFDAVFIGIVADGFLEEGASEGSCRCPLNPLNIRPTMTRQSPAMKFASSMQLLLSDQWLADRGMDGRAWARASRRWFRPALQKARRNLAELGLSMAQLEGFERAQKRVERLGETTLDQAAEPSARALGYVFRQVAALPGALPQLAHESAQARLNAFGRSLGRVIYFTDALEDLEKDLKKGEFNPCLQRMQSDGSLRASKIKIQDCHDALAEDLKSLRATVDALPWRRHKALVQNILCDSLARQSEQATKKLKDFLCRPGHAQFLANESPSRSALNLGSFLCKSESRVMTVSASDSSEKEEPPSKFELVEDIPEEEKRGDAGKGGPGKPGSGGNKGRSGGGKRPPGDDDDFKGDHDDGFEEEGDDASKRSFPSRNFCLGTGIGFLIGVLPAVGRAIERFRRGRAGSEKLEDPKIVCFENVDCREPKCFETCCTSMTVECTSCCKTPCKDCSDSWKGCGDGCSACGKGCSDCGSGCDSCGKSSDSCGNGCDSCGKGCGDCSSCCGSSGSKGCGDCGQCDCGTCCKAQYEPGFESPIIDNIGSCSPF